MVSMDTIRNVTVVLLIVITFAIIASEERDYRRKNPDWKTNEEED